MNDRLTIAATIAAGLVYDVPIRPEDVIDGKDPEAIKEAMACCKAVAQVSLMMANAILLEHQRIEQAEAQIRAAYFTDSSIAGAFVDNIPS